MKVSKLRGVVAFVLAVGVAVAGLAFHVGAGSLSSFGFDFFAAVCPLGSLESIIGARELGLHGALCLVITLFAVVLVGKAFCSWACPVPWLRKFFRPKESASRMGALELGVQTSEEECTSKDCASCEASPVFANCMSDGGADSAPASDGRSGRTQACGESDGLAQVESRRDGHAQACGGHNSALASDGHGDAAPRGGDGGGLAPVGGERDGLALDSRHAVLAGVLASTAAFGFPVFCLVCPVGLSFATLAAVWHLLQFNETTWGLVVFPAILVLEVVFLRKWCFRFCPISALVSLVSCANATFKPHVDADRCLRSKGVDCRMCVDTCPELVDPHANIIPECSKCHACAEKCPAHAITFLLLRR